MKLPGNREETAPSRLLLMLIPGDNCYWVTTGYKTTAGVTDLPCPREYRREWQEVALSKFSRKNGPNPKSTDASTMVVFVANGSMGEKGEKWRENR